MESERPFLHELQLIKAGNALYKTWLEHALAFTVDDARGMIDDGLTYQANAFRSMVRELIAGQKVPTSLLKKLDVLVISCRRQADALR